MSETAGRWKESWSCVRCACRTALLATNIARSLLSFVRGGGFSVGPPSHPSREASSLRSLRTENVKLPVSQQAGHARVVKNRSRCVRTRVYLGQPRQELCAEVGDGANRKGGISWGCLTTSLLHRRSDMPCQTITLSS